MRAVVAGSFARIHRTNLVGMAIMLLQLPDGMSRETLGLTGDETVDMEGFAGGIRPRMDITCRIHRADGSSQEIKLLCRIDTADEVEYYRHGGILHYVLRKLNREAA